MPRPIVMSEPLTGGRDRTDSDSGRPIQRGMSHRAMSVSSAAITGAMASSPIIPENLVPVNAREREPSVGDDSSLHHPITALNSDTALPVAARSVPPAADLPEPEAPAAGEALASAAARSAPEPAVPEVDDDDDWSPVDFLTLGLTKLFAHRMQAAAVQRAA